MENGDAEQTQTVVETDLLADGGARRRRRDAPAADPSFRLDGQTAVVTGGGSGIGLAIAGALHGAGASVALIGRNEHALSSAAETLNSRVAYFVHDVTRLSMSESLFDRVAAELEAPSILINNAGVHLKQPAIATSPEQFAEVMKIHVDGAFALSTAAAKAMMPHGGGSILFIASMASLFGIPYVSAYSAAKTAQLGLVRSLASEWSSHGIRVNAIAPGWIDTQMSRQALDDDPARLDRVLKRTPLGRLGDPDEVARAALFLCSPASSFITGAVLPVDGGASIGF